MSLYLDHIAVDGPTGARLHPLYNTVEDGDFLVILGHNGAGKSTLLDVLVGLEAPSRGAVTGTFAHELQTDGGATYTRPAVRQGRIGYLFQSPEMGLFAGTVAEEFAVTWGISSLQVKQRASEISSLLGQVGLEGIGLDDIPATWSTGMQRRMAFALVLAEHPQVMVLDEPTAGLDATSRSLLVEALRSLHDEGRTVIVATHDADAFVSLATRAWVLDAGQVVYDGRFTELYERPSLFLEHHLGLPPSLRLQTRLQAAGVLHKTRELEPWALIDEIYRDGAVGRGAREALALDVDFEEQGALTPAQEPHTNASRDVQQHLEEHVATREWFTVDPRSRWIAVTLIILAMATVHRTTGILVGLGTTVALLVLFRANARRVLQWSVTWGLFALVTTLIGAAHLGAPFHPAGSYGLSLSEARRSVIAIIPYWCFLQSGQLLVTGTSALEVQGMIDWLLRTLRLPTRARHLGALTGGMVYRFIPAIAHLYQVQLRSYRVRTLANRRQRFAFLRLTHVIAPLVIRLIRYGETTHDALTARNLFDDPVPTDPLFVRTTRKVDWLFAIGGLCAALCIACFR
ncbi:ATP-binding cassette domain-containing protein [Alicyclobacillus fastidiosus]|uniref:ATP-binding cassette domain-containing protein n=1 Tax=Alicyclobacillus fastidiosus TaxID=392011 RepID=A0ABY6ZHM0_9BACL|nr:ATP-binding cassette domain-containing protein [Alicyclobacillus fastidiosus]WAH41624.1 ATP-binding cassette domain-containing protein [Alicyclobacillus fastidiosus]GMA63291.1 hypothetical protein GCM10025859_37310 [Alicyclobacillus fastidiosus]